MTAKKEAKKLRHLGSLRAHFHLTPPATTTTLTSNSYWGHSDHNIYTTTSDHLHGTFHTTLLQDPDSAKNQWLNNEHTTWF